MNKMNSFNLGLYRHFKGGYYYVFNVVTDTTDEDTLCAVYTDAMHPEAGNFVRPLTDFYALEDENGLIQLRKDNVTGQKYRFEKVKSIDNPVENLSTEQLIDELRKREDSPLQDLDIEGLSDLVYCYDLCVGIKHEATDEFPKGVSVQAIYDADEREKMLNNLPMGTKLVPFKRVFIEIK